MNNKSRSAKYAIRIIVVLIAAALIIVFAARIKPDPSEQTSFSIKYDLTLWYYDEALTPYLNSFGDDYFKHTGQRVDVKLVPSLEFFDNINKQNIEGTGAPDLYIIDSSKLENAYLSSLAKPNEDADYNDSVFLSKALEDASYKDRLVAYPLCFNTTYFVTNTEFLKETPADFDAIAALTGTEGEEETVSEENTENAEASEENSEKETTAETKAVKNEIPVLEFDVSNLLYSYFVIADQVNLGGPSGDDASAFDLSGDNYEKALHYFQGLSKKLKIDPNLTDSKTVEKDFIHGQTQTAICSLTSLTKLYGSGVKFTLSRIPDLNKELKSKTMSQTSVICVNPDSPHVDDASRLARYLSLEHADSLFDTCGLFSVVKEEYSNQDFNTITEIYETSASLPKLIETENLWENINTLLVSVWNGDDIERAQSKLNVAVYVALSTRTEQEDK